MIQLLEEWANLILLQLRHIFLINNTPIPIPTLPYVIRCAIVICS